VPVERLAELFGVVASGAGEDERAELEAALGELVGAERAVRGELLAGGTPGEADEVASVASFETLLRWRRAEARPSLEPIPLARLPYLVAWHQRLVERGSGAEGLQRALERLFGFPAPAGAWEREILPARLDPYLPAWLDTLFEESDLRWIGVGRERTTFAFPGDFDLFLDRGAAGPAGPDAELPALEAAVHGELSRSSRGLDLGELVERLGERSGAVSDALWALAWRGRAANDSMRALRQGARSDFRAAENGSGSAPAEGGRPAARRGGFRRWGATRSFTGRWHAIGAPASASHDPIDLEERNRERVRVVADRWGVVFRELLALELPALSWARLARTLRALELGGELVAGHFVRGVSGLQFATPALARDLTAGLPDGGIWWHAATDPASLCGVDLPELKAVLPRRVAGTWLVWRGAEIVATFRRSGREVEFALPADDPALAALVEPLRVALTRGFEPERSIEIETIGGEPAESSAHRRAFASFATTREARGLRLRRSYAS
jgi:ATP-dependent Lhr-like helicase